MASRMLIILGVMMIISTMLRKTSADRNAYSIDIQTCMLDSWTTAKVLASKPTCTGSQKPLCYSAASSVSSSTPADFISCYNTATLIPDYTAHVLAPIPSGLTRPRPAPWQDDTGPNAPTPVSSTSQYAQADQNNLYSNYDPTTNAYLSRGHYVPSSDMGSNNARILTFINTNIAPQWQEANGGKWCNLEQAIVAYVNGLSSGTDKLYIFTGTAGQKKNSTNQDIMLNNAIVTPQYYWKAVCHPGVGSVALYAVNNVGDISTTRSNGCNSISQTSKKGIIQCLSMKDAASQFPTFKLPVFNDTTCLTNQRGTFLDSTLATKLQ